MRRVLVLLVLLGGWVMPAAAQRVQVDGGPQHVICDGGCGGAGVFLDNASFTFGTTPINIGGFVFDDVAPNAATENRAAAARISANRMQLFQIGDGAGNERRALVSAGNSLQVTCDNCGGSTFLDNAAFTFGTSTVLNVGFVRDDVAPNAATENSAAAARISGNRMLLFQLGDGAGNERRANVTAGNALVVDGSAVTQPVSGTFWQATQPVSGTVTTSPPANASENLAQVAGTATDTNSGNKSAGTLRVVLATDQPALTNKLLVTPDSVALPANQSVNVSQINGVTPLMGNGASGTGAQRVTIANDSTGILALTTGSAQIGHLEANQSVNVAQMNGVAVTMNNGVVGTGVQRVTIASDSTGQVAIASLPNEGQQTAANSISVTLASDKQLCSDDSKVTSVVIEGTADAQLVALSGSTIIYVCGYNVISSGTNNVRLISGTGSVCATGLTARTGTYQLTAQTGISVPNGGATQLKTAAGEALCLDVSAAVTVSGLVTYVQQ